MARSDEKSCSQESANGKKPNDIMFGSDTPNESFHFLQSDEALRITVFSLPDGDSVSVFEVDKSSGLGCADTGTGAEIPYDPCCEGAGKEYSKTGTYYIKGSGAFKFVYSGVTGTASVKYAIIKNDSVSERMACPVCKCFDTTWSWTGVEVCDGESVMREEVSNCGTKRLVSNRPTVWTSTGQTRCSNNVVEIEEKNNCGTSRWTATSKNCGYSPSVPFIVQVYDGCCGGSQVGYMYHPDETIDPAATVAVEDCDGVIWGYIYPTAATGRTLPVGSCDEPPIGYAANKSDSAPEFAKCDASVVVNVPKTTVENNVIVPPPPRSVLSVSWLDDNLVLTYSDGSNQVIETPVC